MGRDKEDFWVGQEPGAVMEAISNKSLWTLVSGEGLKTEKGIIVMTALLSRDFPQISSRPSCLARSLC